MQKSKKSKQAKQNTLSQKYQKDNHLEGDCEVTDKRSSSQAATKSVAGGGGTVPCPPPPFSPMGARRGHWILSENAQPHSSFIIFCFSYNMHDKVGCKAKNAKLNYIKLCQISQVGVCRGGGGAIPHLPF